MTLVQAVQRACTSHLLSVLQSRLRQHRSIPSRHCRPLPPQVLQLQRAAQNLRAALPALRHLPAVRPAAAGGTRAARCGLSNQALQLLGLRRGGLAYRHRSAHRMGGYRLDQREQTRDVRCRELRPEQVFDLCCRRCACAGRYFWRLVTPIRNGDQDGNDATGRPSWIMAGSSKIWSMPPAPGSRNTLGANSSFGI